MFKHILIIKTSSIGDILQSFYALPFLKKEGYSIDFVVDYKHQALVKAHPYIDKVIVSDINGWLKKRNKRILFSFFRKNLQMKHYEMAFDLQSNWKSSLILFFTNAKRKIGFGKNSVREKVNLLFTNEKYDISKNMNIRLFYLSLFQKVIPGLTGNFEKVFFLLTPMEQSVLEEQKLFFSSLKRKKILVAIGSNWKNKVPKKSFILAFLEKIDTQLLAHFIFTWGTEQEKEDALQIASKLPSAQVIDKGSFALGQHLIEEMDLVIATDSSILSLSQLTSSPSFSFFGPTKGNVFAPIGNGFKQGSCPYKVAFEKQCPKLRTCQTGSCMKDLEVNNSYQAFFDWYNSIQRTIKTNRPSNSVKNIKISSRR